MEKNKKKIKTHQAIVLYEAMISVFVVAVGMTGVFALMAGSFSETASSRDEVIASFLAQEGVELVRNIRDNNWASNKETFSSDNFYATSTSFCRIDETMTVVECDATAVDYSLNLNGSNYYVHAPGTSTKFKRRIINSYRDDSNNVVTRENAVNLSLYSVVTWDGSTPTSSPSASTCNASSKCAYTRVVLSKWGE